MAILGKIVLASDGDIAIPATGTASILLNVAENISDPHVNSDGSAIVFSRAVAVGGQGRSFLYIYRVSTGAITLLTSPTLPNAVGVNPGDYDAHWSPDRTKIATVRLVRQGLFNIVIIPVGTAPEYAPGTEVVIPPPGSPTCYCGVPEWSSDNLKILTWVIDPQDRAVDGVWWINADLSGGWQRVPTPPPFHHNTVAFIPGSGSGPTASIIYSKQGFVTFQALPVNTVAPTISGTPQEGQPLTADVGTWINGTQNGFNFQWSRAGTDISGATAQIYTCVTADVGSTLKVAVVGINSGGFSIPPTLSAATSIVQPIGGGGTDGLAGAPAGTIQYPTLLNAYGANRPSWNVSGVDYHVGIPSGTTLTDWRTLPGVNLSTGQVSIASGTNYSYANIDFSLGNGGWIYHGGGVTNLTIDSCKFGKCTNSNYAVQDQAGANIILLRCEFDGTLMIAGSAFVTYARSITARYNRFLHGRQHIFEQVRFPTTTSQAIVTSEFNLFDDYAISSGAHANCFQETGNTADSIYTIRYNLFYRFTAPPSAPGEDIQVEPVSSNGTFTFTTPTISNNTMIARRIGTDTGFSLISFFIHGASTANPVVSGQNTNNYFDPTNTIAGNGSGAFYPGTMTPACGWTSSGNKNMLDGTTITPA